MARYASQLLFPAGVLGAPPQELEVVLRNEPYLLVKLKLDGTLVGSILSPGLFHQFYIMPEHCEKVSEVLLAQG